MPSTYSSLLRLELMAIGEKTNTWGTTNNTNLGTLIEKSIAGSTTVDVTAGDVTLTSLNGSDDQARAAILIVTGTPGVTRNVVAPSTSKMYAVFNSSNAVTMLKGVATTGVALAAGEYAYVGWNGSDFIRFTLSPVSPVLTGVPTAPTAAVNTNTTQIATTGFVVGQGYVSSANLSQGSYTPTATNLSGTTAVTFFTTRWIREYDVVSAFGAFYAENVSGVIGFRFALPVASSVDAFTAPVVGHGHNPHTDGHWMFTAVSSQVSVYCATPEADISAGTLVGFEFKYPVV